MNQKVVNIDNQVVGEVALNEAVFGAQVNVPVMHQVVKQQLAKRRRGTAATKGRTDVSGGGRKPFRQKGTGRARAGSNTSPLWVRGGAVFGPQPRDYGFKVPKKVRKAALKSALSAKNTEGHLVVLSELNFGQPKTKQMIELLKNMGLADQKVLFVQADWNENVILSGRNIPGVKVLPVAGLNVYDIMLADRLVVEQPALEAIEKRLA